MTCHPSDCDYATGLRTLLFGPACGLALLVASLLMVQDQPEATGRTSTELTRRERSASDANAYHKKIAYNYIYITIYNYVNLC